MANLYSQYTSGLQFTAGTIVGSAMGMSGLNPIVDRINLMSSDGNVSRMLQAGSTLYFTSGTNYTTIGSILVNGERFKYYSILDINFHTTMFRNGSIIFRFGLSGAGGTSYTNSIVCSGGGLYVNSQGFIKALLSPISGPSTNNSAGYIVALGTSQPASSSEQAMTLVRQGNPDLFKISNTGSDFVIFIDGITNLAGSYALGGYTLVGTPSTFF